MLKTLVGHTSAETAYVQPDYPYGRTLRCKRRVWIETKPGHGQRVVTQTSNPKRSFESWNAPKAGVYHAMAAMALDEDPASETFEHVVFAFWSPYEGREGLERLIAAHGPGLHPALMEGYRRAFDRKEARETAKLKADAVAAVADMPEIPAFGGP